MQSSPCRYTARNRAAGNNMCLSSAGPTAYSHLVLRTCNSTDVRQLIAFQAWETQPSDTSLKLGVNITFGFPAAGGPCTISAGAAVQAAMDVPWPAYTAICTDQAPEQQMMLNCES